MRVDKLPELLAGLARQLCNDVGAACIAAFGVQPVVVDPDFTGSPTANLCHEFAAMGNGAGTPSAGAGQASSTSLRPGDSAGAAIGTTRPGRHRTNHGKAAEEGRAQGT